MEFPTRFNPPESEGRIYRLWEGEGYFGAAPDSTKPPFVVVIPPPNVTGSLHMGHALNNTLQDVLVRWKRMDGHEALYLPGMDHAGIATQAVVEKELKKEGKRRHEMGREAFLQRVWEWKEKYGNTILYQLRRLGCSCDWTRTRFTMDEAYTRAIRVVFVSLFKKGLIYRGLYAVNWCPGPCQTALSDLEVVRKDGEMGKFWFVRYPLKGGGQVTVATTRPETMLGDTAVAVNPKDPRYESLVGRSVLLPFVNREIPVIADEFVDSSFGTGAVKITPAHDAADFECASRHSLRAVVVLDSRGSMNENAGPFRGLDRFDCRERIVSELGKLGLLEKVEETPSYAGRCYRCDTILEPYLSEQWFVRMRELARPAIEAVRRGDVRFVPDRWSKVYFDWMESIRDWCISRQLWWGHRIPVWYCACGESLAAVETPPACPKCGTKEMRQDEDVLDTWFSSALWPFATLGWPEETPDLEKFYPTQTLVTGRDIINLWVARMIMSGLEFRGEVPFRTVVINATLMDDNGERMSKSKGTGVDPLELIDKYGADAVRFALVRLSTGSQDIRFGRRLSQTRTEDARNFVTKLWNACRYVSQKVGAAAPSLPENPAIEDRWILSRLSTVGAQVSECLAKYDFSEVAQALYRFVWNDFCDWYIELSKRRVEEEDARRTLSYVVDVTLRLLHPLAPFVTEEIWQRFRELGAEKAESMMLASWPEPPASLRDPELEEEMDLVFECVRAIREKRNANKIAAKQALAAVISARDDRSARLLEAGRGIIVSQANLSDLKIGNGLAKPSRSLTAESANATIWLPMGSDFDARRERELTRKEIEERRLRRERLQAQLSNSAFRAAKPELAAKLEEELRGLDGEIASLEAHRKEIEEL